jgi:hypothetical protein
MTIFVDASWSTTNSHAGFYVESKNHLLSMPIKARTSVRAETIACLLALRYKNSKVLTDCMPAYDYIATKYPKYCDNLSWVPRKQNAIADRLSRMYETVHVKPAKSKPLDYRTYILTKSNDEKLNLYKNLATESWQFEMVKAIENQFVAIKTNPDAIFKHKGKFYCNNPWVNLIWMTNEHKTIGRGFFKFLKSRGQQMQTQYNAIEFKNLLNTLKQKREEYDRHNRSTNGEII